MTPPDAGNPFGAAPPPPEQPDGTARPRTVDYSFWSGILCPVIGFVMLAVAFMNFSDAELRVLVDQLGAAGQPELTIDQARALVRMTFVITMVFSLVLAGLWIMFLVFMRNGRNWARVVITVLAALWLLLTIPSLFGGSAGGVLVMLIALLQIAAVLETLITAYLAPSNTYFTQNR